LDPTLASVRDVVADGSSWGLRVHYTRERKFNGAAACAGLFREELKDDPFLLVNGNSFSQVDLTPLLLRPESGGPFLNIGVYAGIEGMRAFGAKHAVLSRPLGDVFWEGHNHALAHAYFMHPQILSLIPEGKYCDLREQLIPVALKKGLGVRGVPLTGDINDLHTFQDYLRANHDAVRAAKAAGTVLVSPSADVAPTAVISGPVLIGDGVRIGPDSVVVGPAVLGPGSVIGRGALVSESVVGPRARVGIRSELRRSIVAERAKVSSKQRCAKTVVLDRTSLPNGHLHMLREVADGAAWNVVTHQLQDHFHVPNRVFYLLSKRLVDVSFAFAAAPFALTLSLLLGVLVKLTSKGPMFFHERRITRGGREFSMIKLRTMYVGAHLDQGKLRDENQTDGPMFKILHDPRITPFGNWLRRTSLDELPQLWNVFKGDMSLVGPRPLADRELKWHPVWRALRLQVRPGMTGLWQVRCGSYSDFADWIGYDVQYVQNACPSLDLLILIKTIGVVFFGRRAAEH
jgi:lipopolysaccharide/colanic/teichoic acid biosynthesis glycosyltransferase/NDP-sugar pyrophosphorylase family protein